MWSTNNPNQGWDGIGPDGKPAQNGSYVYDISYMLEGGREIHERGEFKLIR
jgi:flagellar hook assembly protein FlgD